MRAEVGILDLARYFLRLGAFGFGGPIALAGYMQRDLVEKRGWFTQDEYLVGLAAAQMLPGPLAAQLAMWLGYVRHGVAGALVAAVAFVSPPFVLVCAVAAAYVALAGTSIIQALFHGVGPAVLALILRGAWKLVRVTVRDDPRLWVIFAAVASVTFAVRTEVAILFVAAGLVGIALYRRPAIAGLDPVLAQLLVFFLKAGAFTFGSGLAIVPFLQQGVVAEFHWLTERQFLDAIAIGVITPGPVVIAAVFVGYVVAGLLGAIIAGLGVFLPPLVMVLVLAPWIMRHRANPTLRGFTAGAIAAAAGAIVGAAGVIATQILIDPATVAIFAIALLVLWRANVPEPAVVGAAAVAGIVLAAVR